MPKSRGRRDTRRRYQLGPQRKSPKKKSSPRWYAPLVLGVMGLGLVIIILNYMEVMPFTQHRFSSTVLVIGLALIAVGFIGTTGIR